MVGSCAYVAGNSQQVEQDERNFIWESTVLDRMHTATSLICLSLSFLHLQSKHSKNWFCCQPAISKKEIRDPLLDCLHLIKNGRVYTDHQWLPSSLLLFLSASDGACSSSVVVNKTLFHPNLALKCQGSVAVLKPKFEVCDISSLP